MNLSGALLHWKEAEMARSLESRIEGLEVVPVQSRPLSDAERAIRLHKKLSEGWTPPAWLARLITPSRKTKEVLDR